MSFLGKIATFSTLTKMLQHHNLHLFQAYGEKLKMNQSLTFYLLSHCCKITCGDELQSHIKPVNLP